MVLKRLICEWDWDRNGSPDGYSDYSNKKVWWVCAEDIEHRWQAIINNRTKGTRCPYCSGRYVSKKNALAQHLDIVKELHPEKSKDIDPEKIAQYSSKRVWWKCSAGHEWITTIGARTIGQNCPCCSGQVASKTNNLAFMFSDIASEWHPKNELRPENCLPFSKKKVWWLCKFGHEWETSISNRTLSGTGCHVCSGYNTYRKCEESEDGNSKRCNNCGEMKQKKRV